MLAFFYSLFKAIIVGSWVNYNRQEVMSVLTPLINRTGSLIINALGGHYDTLQTFVLVDETTLQAPSAIAVILAVIATIMVCLLTFKLTKMVFSIFFGGR